MVQAISLGRNSAENTGCFDQEAVGCGDMMDQIKTSLLEIGLSQKEIDVYITMLQIGPMPIQDIAERAGVNRSTTYVLMEQLQKRGLVSCFEKGKKTVFAADDPQRLMTQIVNELSSVEAKRERLEQCLPWLLAIFNAMENKPKVRFFEGEEALDAVRREIVLSYESIWELQAVDEICLQLSSIKGAERIELTKRVRHGRFLMAIKPGIIPPFFDRKGLEARVIDYHRCPFSGSLTLSGNRAYIITTQARGLGIVIESKEVVDLLRAMYEAAWQGARSWNPPVGWGETMLQKENSSTAAV
jgi:sugar-specific transcriptional regulator TrmB